MSGDMFHWSTLDVLRVSTAVQVHVVDKELPLEGVQWMDWVTLDKEIGVYKFQLEVSYCLEKWMLSAL